jgi:hypothetical protein
LKMANGRIQSKSWASFKDMLDEALPDESDEPEG